MTSDHLLILGGIGLFLFGMATLTDGLKGLANAPLRRMLARFTRTPLSGAATGALATAVIQSSSATTVTAVGFVGAGLLTFTQALGIIFGANLGTTLKGWVIALFGFKVELGLLAMPLLLVGVMLSLLLPGRAAQAGRALAGFSLLFIGLGVMQDGVGAFQGQVTPSDFPDDTLLGRLQLVALGIVMTVITQSSSVGVAAALVALNAGAISFPQAAAMVIGMDVGTTVTAAMATLGGSRAMRQTGFAHVIYNLITGLAAFLMLDLFQAALSGWVEAGEKEFALVAFHTGFNFLGVVVVLPFAGAFARLIERLIPDDEAIIASAPDQRLLSDSGAALDAATGAMRALAAALFAALASAMAQPSPSAARLSARARRVGAPLEDLAAYLARIKPAPGDEAQERRLQSLLHAVDHLERMAMRFGQTERIEALGTDAELLRLSRMLGGLARGLTDGADLRRLAGRLGRMRRVLRDRRDPFRDRRLSMVPHREANVEMVFDQMDAMRWLHRVSYHAWRVVHHLERAEPPAPPPPEPRLDPSDAPD